MKRRTSRGNTDSGSGSGSGRELAIRQRESTRIPPRPARASESLAALRQGTASHLGCSQAPGPASPVRPASSSWTSWRWTGNDPPTPRGGVPGRTQNGTHAAPPTQVSPGCLGLRAPGERRKDAWCDLSVWPPRHRAGARAHLRGAQVPVGTGELRLRPKHGKRKGGVPGAGLPASWETSSALALHPSIHPSPHASSLRGPPIGRSAELALGALRGGAGRRPAGLRHQPAPAAAALHVGPVASWREPRRPRRRSAITGSARTPTPWRTTRCASERAWGGRAGAPAPGGPGRVVRGTRPLRAARGRRGGRRSWPAGGVAVLWVTRRGGLANQT